MATSINTIAYSLYRNHLTKGGGGDNYIARVNVKGYVGLEALTEMITERNSTVTKQEVYAVLDLLGEVVKSSIEMGFNVNTGFLRRRCRSKEHLILFLMSLMMSGTMWY